MFSSSPFLIPYRQYHAMDPLDLDPELTILTTHVLTEEVQQVAAQGTPKGLVPALEAR